MKKVWIIGGFIVGLVLIYFIFAYFSLVPVYKCFEKNARCSWTCMEGGNCRLVNIFSLGRFDRITYKNREYNLGDRRSMTIQELKDNNFGDAIATGVFYHSREVYDSSPTNWSYASTVIFLKEKNTDRFDIYSLVGGP